MRQRYCAAYRLRIVEEERGDLATYAYDPLDRLRLADYGATRTRFRYVGLTTSAAQTIDDLTGGVIRQIGTGWTGERLLDWTGTNSNLRYYYYSLTLVMLVLLSLRILLLAFRLIRAIIGRRLSRYSRRR